ncbi:MAG TPA: TetR/AcrR family transcriptional regulator [Pirellulales bacterium]|jgi:AcrR family transcriptional regulator|nr:TetR/AcrR family transcriptional regulator [Pirellulales bacterium]
MSRETAHAADRCEEILDTATRLFAQHGFAGTDTQMLADALHVGKGTLYRYFPSKRELFLAAADRGIRKLCEHIEASIADIEDPPERISKVVYSYLGFFADHPELVELLIHERSQFKDRKKPTYFEHREANREHLRNLYRSYISEGQIRDMPVDRILDVLGDLLYGTMFTNYFSGRQKSVEAQARDILDVIFHGILSDAGRRRHAPEGTQDG